MQRMACVIPDFFFEGNCIQRNVINFTSCCLMSQAAALRACDYQDDNPGIRILTKHQSAPLGAVYFSCPQACDYQDDNPRIRVITKHQSAPSGAVCL